MKTPDFLISYEAVLERVKQIDPLKYAKTRNFIAGDVTYLSPFLTHGIISTKRVADEVLQKFSVRDSEKLLAELGWREFFHRVWQAEGENIFNDLRYEQSKVVSEALPTAVASGDTGLLALDQSIKNLKQTGYMHNHARMWTASITGNLGQTHWYHPARWLYYHLLDGDLASNTLSWQWIVGSFSHKKYYANQANLNKFSDQKQNQTWLAVDYEDFDTMGIPDVLQNRESLNLTNEFPASTAEPISANSNKKTILLYSIWNLDPSWHQPEDAHRLLWIDPAMHTEMALSPKRWEFINHWAKQIEGLQIFVGSKDELFPQGVADLNIITREYPETSHWPGEIEPREWLYPQTSGYFKNFFSFWKQAQKELPVSEKLHQPHKN